MIRKGFFAVVVAALVIGISVPASASPGRAAARPVVSAARINAFLRSADVDPASAVVQRGVRNYARPNCPGRGWTCASSNVPVIQIAGPGGANRVSCATAGHRCVAMQVAAGVPNIAIVRFFINHTGPTPVEVGGNFVSISQDNTDAMNEAIVQEGITESLSPQQAATNEVAIAQTNHGSGENVARVIQHIAQFDDETAVGDLTQNQIVYETSAVAQSSESGPNTANVVQSTRQRMVAGGGSGTITQQQNPPNNNQGAVTSAIAQTSTGGGADMAFNSQRIGRYQRVNQSAADVTQLQECDGPCVSSAEASATSGTSTQTIVQHQYRKQVAHTTGSLSQTFTAARPRATKTVRA